MSTTLVLDVSQHEKQLDQHETQLDQCLLACKAAADALANA